MEPHICLIEIVKTIKKGYDHFSWIFFVSSIAAILGSIFRLAGIASFILALAFFYFAERLHERASKSINAK